MDQGGVPSSDVKRTAEAGTQGRLWAFWSPGRGAAEKTQYSWAYAEASLTGIRMALASLEAWETQTGH